MIREQQKFYICKHCGNIIGFINSAGVPLVCCGEKMAELIPNTTDATKEKHVPVVRVTGNTVTVDIGSLPHPMIKEHYIMWVYIQTKKGGQRVVLAPDDKPTAKFMLTDDDKIQKAFIYCNLHSLWMTDVK
jgi:superoxide reductase